MFVFSLRANKPKLIAALCVLLLVLVIISFFVDDGGSAVTKGTEINAKASNEAERIAFLSQFGWKIDEDPIEVTEVIIPSEFNDTYSSYNEIQKKQTMDLEPYKGERVKKWVYGIKNYPGYNEESDLIRATLLIYNGIVIGGDVSSVEPNGFMQGFDFPEQTNQVS